MSALHHFARACAIHLALSPVGQAARLNALMFRRSMLEAPRGLMGLCEAVSKAAEATAALDGVLLEWRKRNRRKPRAGGQFRRRGRRLGVR